MIKSFLFLSILLPLKYNVCNSLKFTFSNTFISDIALPLKSNSFNTLKFTFSNIYIYDI